MTDARKLIERLTVALDNAIRVIGHKDGTQHIDTARPVLIEALYYLATPEPAAGPTYEEWEAIKERTWDQFRTVGYQGEQFIYDRDFDTALDGVRQALARYSHQPPQPIPVSETEPGPEDSDAEGCIWIWLSTEQWSRIHGDSWMLHAFDLWLPGDARRRYWREVATAQALTIGSLPAAEQLGAEP